jgi:hypothetical protein
MTSQAASAHQTGTEDDGVLRIMREAGIPVTRENYLHIAYFSEIPDPWGAELEVNLPVELQDWSQFK